MWTAKNRGTYDRSKLRYPSDLTEAGDHEEVCGAGDDVGAGAIWLAGAPTIEATEACC